LVLPSRPASREYVDRHGKPERVENLARHPLVCLDESMSNHRLSKWLGEVAPNAKGAARNNAFSVWCTR
jgi:hypothetical protein